MTGSKSATADRLVPALTLPSPEADGGGEKKAERPGHKAMVGASCADIACEEHGLER